MYSSSWWRMVCQGNGVPGRGLWWMKLKYLNSILWDYRALALVHCSPARVGSRVTSSRCHCSRTTSVSVEALACKGWNVPTHSPVICTLLITFPTSEMSIPSTPPSVPLIIFHLPLFIVIALIQPLTISFLCRRVTMKDVGSKSSPFTASSQPTGRLRSITVQLKPFGW